MKQTRLLEIIREEIASALGEAATTYAGKTSIDDLNIFIKTTRSDIKEKEVILNRFLKKKSISRRQFFYHGV